MVRHWDGTRWLNIPDGVTGPAGPSGPMGPSGVAGASGAPGASGASGMPGASAADYFLYTQVSASSSWIINHTLNRPCAVTVLDTDGTVIEADVYFVSSTSILIEFSLPQAGQAYLT